MNEIIKELEYEALRYKARAEMAEELIEEIRKFSWHLALKADNQLSTDLNSAMRRQQKEIDSLKERHLQLDDIVKRLKNYTSYVSNKMTNAMQDELIALKQKRDLFEKQLDSLEEVN